MGDGTGGPFNGATQKIVNTLFVLLLAGFGALVVRSEGQLSEALNRLSVIETSQKAAEDSMRFRTEDRYRQGDAARDFALDRAEMANLRSRLDRLEQYYKR